MHAQDHNHLVEQMREIRAAIFSALDEHEKNEHEGRPCWATRASMIAYLMHALQMPDALFPAIREVKQQYDDHCPDRCVPGHATEGLPIRPSKN